MINFSLGLLFLLVSCGKPIVDKKESLNKSVSALHAGISEGILLETPMSQNFDYLPLKGELKSKNKYWSGDSWRLDKGAINLRWNSPLKEGFNYLSPGARQAFTYPKKMLEELSPAEKYDLYMGRYDYPLKWEVDFLARSGSLSWEGLCHGWAGATINHPEPSPKILTNPDGVEIPFGSSDIKALLSWAYSKVLIKNEESLGKRCEDDGDYESDYHENCNDDLSALSFHVVLTNKIGLRSQPIIADMDRFKEVWNHPILSYSSTIEKMVSAPHGRTGIIKTQMVYLDVIEKNSWEKHPPIKSKMTVRYELKIDKGGNIIKGRWLSRERPDFLWTIKEQTQFEGYLGGILDLLK